MNSRITTVVMVLLTRGPVPEWVSRKRGVKGRGGGERGLLKSKQGPPVLLTFLSEPPGTGPAVDTGGHAEVNSGWGSLMKQEVYCPYSQLSGHLSEVPGARVADC